MTQRLKLMPAVLCLIMICQSCIKNVLPPIPFPIQLNEQTPFKSFIDSINGLGSATQLGILRVTINSPFFAHEAVPGQSIIGYSFRSSVSGKVTSLGVLLPAQGFIHNVILWDSINYQILAQADVPSLDSGRFTYVSLTLANQAVAIQPNHGYIVTFNSLNNGSALNTYSNGNNIYLLNGIYHFFAGGNSLTPILPFTQGAITYEASYSLPYNNILSLPPLAQAQVITDASLIPGVCDIGFTPN